MRPLFLSVGAGLLAGCTVRTGDALFETITREEAWTLWGATTVVDTDDTGPSGGDDSGDTIEPSAGDCLRLTGAPDRLFAEGEWLLPRGDEARTVEARVRSDSSAGEQYVFAWGVPAQGQSFMLGVWGGEPFLTQDGDALPSGVLIDDGQFHHLAVTFDRVTVRLYVDGVERAGRAMEVDTDLGGEVVIGNAVPDDGSKHFSGWIDAIRVWEAVVDPDVIADQMATPLQGDEVGLVAWWDLDGAGTGSGFQQESRGPYNGLTMTADGDADSPRMEPCP